jgi:purine-cytosine permease-like protein
LIIAVPLGAIIGATVLSLAAWAGAYNGVPTVLALRPAFGSGGAALLGVALSVTLVCWAAVQLRAATEAVAVAFDQAGLQAPQDVMTISVIGLVSAVLVLIGPAKVASVWVSRVVFWVAVVAVGLAIWLLSTQPDRAGLRVPEQTSALWLGIDAVLALGILWFPLVSDVSRFATDESVAASGTALGFGSTAVIGSLVGGTAALLGAGPTNIAAGITSSLPGFAGLIVVLVWILTVQTLLPFAVGYVSGMCAASITGRRIAWAVALVTVAAIVVLAIVLGSDSVAALEPPLVLLAAVASVYLVDFYVVRRRVYRTDQFYGRGSIYGVLNPWGLLAVGVGVSASLLVHPVGPAPMVEWIEGLAVRAPLADLALPGLATAMVLAGLIHWVLGRMLVREEIVVSPVRL